MVYMITRRWYFGSLMCKLFKSWKSACSGKEWYRTSKMLALYIFFPHQVTCVNFNILLSSIMKLTYVTWWGKKIYKASILLLRYCCSDLEWYSYLGISIMATILMTSDKLYGILRSEFKIYISFKYCSPGRGGSFVLYQIVSINKIAKLHSAGDQWNETVFANQNDT